MTIPSFVCPRCGMVSHNPTDLGEGYCGACHDWTGGPMPLSAAKLGQKITRSAVRMTSIIMDLNTSPAVWAEVRMELIGNGILRLMQTELNALLALDDKLPE